MIMTGIELLERYKAGDFEESTREFLNDEANKFVSHWRRRHAGWADVSAEAIHRLEGSGVAPFTLALVVRGKGSLFFRSVEEMLEEMSEATGMIEDGRAFPYALEGGRRILGGYHERKLEEAKGGVGL